MSWEGVSLGWWGPLPAGYGKEVVFPPQPIPKQPTLMSDHISLQFEKLGYSQPWIQVPTFCVYLTGKEQHEYEIPCARYAHNMRGLHYWKPRTWTVMRPARPPWVRVMDFK